MKRRQAFTLVELLIVIAIIAILAALIFPAFARARESARRTTCTSNLHQIGLAVQIYRTEEKEFPTSLAVLLPPSDLTTSASSLDNTSGAVPTPMPKIDGKDCDAAGTACPNPGGTGYLKSTNGLFCPDDDGSRAQPRASYGDLSTGVAPRSAVANTAPAALSSPEQLNRYTWNFWGYRVDGTAYATESEAANYNDPALPPIGYNSVPAAIPQTNPPTVVNPLLVDPTQPYHFTLPSQTFVRTNVVKNSLSNRFAPANTIVTYCIYHLTNSSNLSTPEKLYDAAEANNIAGARALVLRLDASVKSVDVSAWNINGNDTWQKQDF